MSDETDVEDASERLLLKAAKLRSDYDALLSEAADLRERLEIADGQRESAFVRARLADEDTDAVRTVLAASEAEVTRLREELDQAKLDIAEARELIASYDKDTRKLREERDDAAQSWVDLTAQVTAARRQLEKARGRLRSGHPGGRWGEPHKSGCETCAFLAAPSPAPAPTCATWCARWLYEWPEGSIPPTRAIVFDEAERASRCFCTAACRDAGAPRNPVKPCETCGVTGGEGFLITNEDGTPCLDRPCPTCSRSVKP